MFYGFLVEPLFLEKYGETIRYCTTVSYDTANKDYVIKDITEQGYEIVKSHVFLCYLNEPIKKKAMIVQGELITE
ncbi:MAG: hypothetical protein WC657_09155 [Candidatus Paceibacterota bacterium]|jgi:hypothetical protein